jgi:hypothetical protein
MDVKPCLPYEVAFQIHVEYTQITIKCIVTDEGDETCVMSLTCWKSIGSLILSQSITMLTALDGCSFRPHRIIPTFLVQLGGNTVEVDVEVVDGPLGYNLLLGYNWTYAMTVVMSSIFRTLCFPHQGKIMMIDKLSFRTLVLMHRLDLQSQLSTMLGRKLRILVFECIPISWVDLIPWHQSINFIQFLVGLHRR